MEPANITQHKKFYGLDHLRALAIALVFVFHYSIITGGEPLWLNDISQIGWTGVDLFFVLSGFLIASQLFEETKKTGSFSYKNFLIKRCFRILPAYWCVLAIYFCFPVFHEREALPPLWKFVTFTQNFGLDIKSHGTFSHAWSLCVEEHFYFFLPLILALLLQFPKLFKKSFWLLPVLFALCICIRYYSFQHLYLPNAESPRAGYYWYQYIYYPTWCRLDGLLIGVSIAATYCFQPAVWKKISKLGNWLFLLSLIVFVIAYRYCSEQQSLLASVIGFSLVAVGYAFLLAASISPKNIFYQWKSRTTSFIAAISYALYLTHKGIIHITMLWLKDRVNAGMLFFICILTSIAAAYLLHRAIEKPFMAWRQKLIKPDDQSARTLSSKNLKTEASTMF
jgi:peptidoglycan/LPS O-acetylase OafA/YrhL